MLIVIAVLLGLVLLFLWRIEQYLAGIIKNQVAQEKFSQQRHKVLVRSLDQIAKEQQKAKERS